MYLYWFTDLLSKEIRSVKPITGVRNIYPVSAFNFNKEHYSHENY